MAELVSASLVSCWRRVKALEQAATLGPAVRLIRPEAVERDPGIFCQICMRLQDAAACQEFQRAMSLEPTILGLYSILGE